MASLTRTWKWERYEPNLGDNREQPEPFFLKVKSGVTRDELRGFEERIAAAAEMPTEEQKRAALALFSEFLEWGAHALVLGERRVASLAEYLEFLDTLVDGGTLVAELAWAIRWHNSVRGTRANFFERLSGGTAYTASPKTA
jgi:hypothetical protein